MNNESSEIIRIFNTAFDDVLLGTTSRGLTIDLYPQALRQQINEHNGWHYDNINNGV